ncbi:discoidin domain-containing protein [Tessaracoccus flavus]|uniref:NAD glycohydrolase translocation F5/8 type C domain-containing protein n=1 Tax=Tessaracoccus flavus TaxID=1610493 RepID=A0A1Q2CC74_9ACTN|nr:discoidin domain-containing protein [Tessaracoccus flavus]AQP43697.1 hypothetical protein RPIT_01795 [Tessaracoccus flavus]
MVQRVPDEYFRKRAAESEDIDESADERHRPPSTTARAVVARDAQGGLPPRATAIVVVLALALSFLAGRLFLFPPVVVPPTPSSSASTSMGPDPSTDAFSAYEGPVSAVQPIAALGECREGGTLESPSALLDGDPETLWRCRGAGDGESFTIVFDGPVSLAGIRIVNGNVAWPDRYAVERRITAVRWTFADGSYFEQGLAANDRNAQEVRFPETLTDRATLEVLSATVPGEISPNSDAVSISSLEFLTPAR